MYDTAARNNITDAISKNIHLLFIRSQPQNGTDTKKYSDASGISNPNA
jgi:hypothetical protein